MSHSTVLLLIYNILIIFSFSLVIFVYFYFFLVMLCSNTTVLLLMVQLRRNQAGPSLRSSRTRTSGLQSVSPGPGPERRCHLAGVQVGGMLHVARVVAVVSLLDDGVQQLCKHLGRRPQRLFTVPPSLSAPSTPLLYIHFVVDSVRATENLS